MAPILEKDPTLLAASSWNDNGQLDHVLDNSRLYRTDFFPGLGWMLTSKVWLELSEIWPEAFWDDWLRNSKRMKGRQVIVPEVCRTFNHGFNSGSTGGEFVRHHFNLTLIILAHTFRKNREKQNFS